MVEAFEKTCGRRFPFKITKRRPGDVAICYANALKAKQKLGWRAEKGIEEMCIDSWRWQAENPHGYEQSKTNIESPHLSNSGDFLIKS
ncbi:UDP-glucose 4-epimerase [Neobacillus vireti LMG 21834]|uniref:UDP-glucose 4-epimerase n=1 Tax=Neobacillus vireti LMG 21834 TaxID=1131730 RepID=A0AB94IKK4_9BACI|nr:UDP-glucose 4-epimerase [Neobacillus vireti LMG 21834]KLT18486.1 hypothetical protein AA980_09245 [Neobacillus vireti]